ncbi:hypothetical protein [Natrinema altunense]|uniref:Uncharacterized protein n=1 Tax=Natrinema altunense TaxID=222984 RepID=A0A482XZQ6_9EURY|nr:hypothetical protein [Natrinema altunense]RZH68702.1 hypothetical protein ELS17_04335 [Natrinema altunense]
MDRRGFLTTIGCSSVLGFSGCSMSGKNKQVKTTHRHIKSSSVWNGISSDVSQTIFVPDVVLKNSHANIHTTIDISGPENMDLKPKKTTVMLIIDNIVDRWNREWDGSNQQSGTLAAELDGGGTVSIVSQTTFASGGSVDTTRYEELTPSSG